MVTWKWQAKVLLAATCRAMREAGGLLRIVPSNDERTKRWAVLRAPSRLSILNPLRINQDNTKAASRGQRNNTNHAVSDTKMHVSWTFRHVKHVVV